MTEKDLPETVSDEQEKTKPSVPGALGKIGRVIFRILVAILIGLALGVGLYSGALRLYKETIEPIQYYEDRITVLERSLEQLQQSISVGSAELQSGQMAIEGRLAEHAEALASAEALIQSTQEDLREQRRILGTVEELNRSVEDMNIALEQLSLLVEEFEQEIISGDLTARRVQRTAVYLQAMSMLTRAQLELDRNNLGFAAEQISAAQATLGVLSVEDPAESEEIYGDEELVITILDRIALALADLPARPDIAGDELEAIWSLIIEALQPSVEETDAAGGE